MSISSEIIRLETAKANIKAAIQSKGVTVPDDTKIDGMADAISAIKTGGDTSMENALITRTVTEYKNDSVETIGNYAFA